MRWHPQGVSPDLTWSGKARRYAADLGGARSVLVWQGYC